MAEATIGFVIDCSDPEELARFWAGALGMERVGAAGNYVLLRSPTKSLPKLLLQRVPEAKSGKNRMHLDIDTPDVDDEVARLIDLGAVRIEEDDIREHGARWVVMADPEGNEFCVCDVSDSGGV